MTRSKLELKLRDFEKSVVWSRISCISFLDNSVIPENEANFNHRATSHPRTFVPKHITPWKSGNVGRELLLIPPEIKFLLVAVISTSSLVSYWKPYGEDVILPRILSVGISTYMIFSCLVAYDVAWSSWESNKRKIFLLYRLSKVISLYLVASKKPQHSDSI